jgi:hypothetical protein
MTLRRRFFALTAVCLTVVLGGTAAAHAAATTVDFESFTGPSVFGAAEPPLTVGEATFSGGLIMTAVLGLLPDQSTVYGTADFCAGCASSITITFSTPVDDFSAKVLNGTTATVSYTVSSSLGDSVTKSLGNDLASGADTFTLPDAGITSVTVTTTTPSRFWDFFIDNVSYNVPTPSNPFPTNRSECKNGGWQSFGVFKNQGDCVSYVATQGKNLPG